MKKYCASMMITLLLNPMTPMILMIPVNLIRPNSELGISWDSTEQI